MNGSLLILKDGHANQGKRKDSVGAVVTVGGNSVLIECGPGVAEAMLASKIDPCSITDAFVSHGHPDHTAGWKDFVDSLVSAGLQQQKANKLRLWGPPNVVDELMDLACDLPSMRQTRRKKRKPLMIYSGAFDPRFTLFNVKHGDASSRGLYLQLDGQRILYPGDTGSETNFEPIRKLPPPTLMLFEVSNGIGRSTLRHTGLQEALELMSSLNPNGATKVFWHIRHDYDQVVQGSLEYGVIVGIDQLNIPFGGKS